MRRRCVGGGVVIRDRGGAGSRRCEIEAVPLPLCSAPPLPSPHTLVDQERGLRVRSIRSRRQRRRQRHQQQSGQQLFGVSTHALSGGRA